MNKPRTKPLQGVCNRIAGSTNAGAIIYRANYWMPKASIDLFGDGRIWIAKTAEVWCEETGLSIDGYRRAITKLRRNGLIETRQAFFGHRYITHLRLTEKATELIRSEAEGATDNIFPSIRIKKLSQVHEPSAPMRGKDAQPMGEANDAAGLRKSTHSYENRENNERNNNERESGSIDDTAFEPEVSQQGFRGKKDNLYQIWTDSVGTQYSRHVSLTLANKKQLRQFVDRCPKGMEGAVLTEVVSRWGTFTAAAKAEAGAFNLPGVPQVEFLLRFADVAVNLWRRYTEKEERCLSREKREGVVAEKSEEIVAEQRRHIENEERLRLVLEEITLTDEEEDERRAGEWEPDRIYVPAPPSVVCLDNVPWSKVTAHIRNLPAEKAHRVLFLRHIIAVRRGLIGNDN